MDTAVEIARQVREGGRTARQVVEEALSAIGARDPELHAFNHVMADEARGAADALDLRLSRGVVPGPLAGAPVAPQGHNCTRGRASTPPGVLGGAAPPLPPARQTGSGLPPTRPLTPLGCRGGPPPRTAMPRRAPRSGPPPCSAPSAAVSRVCAWGSSPSCSTEWHPT